MHMKTYVRANTHTHTQSLGIPLVSELHDNAFPVYTTLTLSQGELYQSSIVEKVPVFSRL